MIQQSEIDKNKLSSVSYNMNILQGIKSKHTFVVSLNQDELINPKKILKQFEYDHPIFSKFSEEVKKKESLYAAKIVLIFVELIGTTDFMKMVLTVH